MKTILIQVTCSAKGQDIFTFSGIAEPLFPFSIRSPALSLHRPLKALADRISSCFSIYFVLMNFLWLAGKARKCPVVPRPDVDLSPRDHEICWQE